MASVNKVIIIGNLGRDPEMRTFPNGDAVANVAIATTDKWKDKQSGEMRQATEWHNVVFSGRLAEVAGQYLRKGSQVYIEGSLRTRKWEKDGVTRYSTEIRADNMQMLGGRQQDGGQDDGYGQQQPAPRQQQDRQPQQQQRQAPQQGGYPAPQQQRQPAPRDSSGFDNMDDDIPFRDPLSYRGAHLAL